MKRYQLMPGDVNERAFEIYSNSTFVVYRDNDGFYIAMNEREKPEIVGNLKQVESFLILFGGE